MIVTIYFLARTRDVSTLISLRRALDAPPPAHSGSPSLSHKCMRATRTTTNIRLKFALLARTDACTYCDPALLHQSISV